MCELARTDSNFPLLCVWRKVPDYSPALAKVAAFHYDSAWEFLLSKPLPSDDSAREASLSRFLKSELKWQSCIIIFVYIFIFCFFYLSACNVPIGDIFSAVFVALCLFSYNVCVIFTTLNKKSANLFDRVV